MINNENNKEKHVNKEENEKYINEITAEANDRAWHGNNEK